jgi:hypothetical protein
MRAGRKRKQDVPRRRDGKAIAVDGRIFTTTWREDVIITIEDQKTVATASRKTVLERIGVGKSGIAAGNELERLWHLCRKYATSAPSINAKVSSLNSGHGHEGDLTEDVIDFGVKVHAKYQGGIRAMVWAKYEDMKEPDPVYGRQVVVAVLAACLENKALTDSGAILCRQGLAVLSDHWNY